MKVVIVRDRESAGGGIFNYYQQVGPCLKSSPRFVNVGRGHDFYGEGSRSWIDRLPTPLRLAFDWFHLLLELMRFPDLVQLNPGLDIKTQKSLRRDAVNLLLAKVFARKVVVFWRGWHNDACGTPEFPGGNDGWMSRTYRKADAHIVLAGVFRDDLRRWGFESPIYLETTVVGKALMEASPGVRVLDSDRPFRILFLSRVEEAKGVFEMIEAFKKIESQRPGAFEYTVAGDGPGLAEIKEVCENEGLGMVQFPGYVQGEDKIRVLKDHDAFCFLSYTEGMPNAVLEAMAMGLPLVSSLAGGLKDILEGGRSGFDIPYDRKAPVRERFPENLVAERMIELATNPELYGKMSDHNFNLARERFAASKVAARLEVIWQEVREGRNLSQAAAELVSKAQSSS